jgi:hypothetical protein
MNINLIIELTYQVEKKSFNLDIHKLNLYSNYYLNFIFSFDDSQFLSLFIP